MPDWVVWLIVGIAASVWLWTQLIRRKVNLLQRDPKAFHDWSIECVRASRRTGRPIPNLVVDYLVQEADLKWATIIGLSETGIAPIKAAIDLELAPLMRFQVCDLAPAEKVFFIEQATRQSA